MGGISGHAGLFSCLDDLATYSRMMLCAGNRLLKPGTIEDATRIWSDDGENAYGLSWFKRKSPINPAGEVFSPRAFGHTGYTGTSIWMDPDRDLFAILLTNRVHPERAEERIPEMNRLRGRFHDISAG
jgi:CubicO group peptidase (beta-lactamase class C family)